MNYLPKKKKKEENLVLLVKQNVGREWFHKIIDIFYKLIEVLSISN